jgi:hypothetical protein
LIWRVATAGLARRGRGKIGGGGSNAGVPLIMGAWTRRLQKWVGFGKSVIVRAITAITKSLKLAGLAFDRLD